MSRDDRIARVKPMVPLSGAGGGAYLFVQQLALHDLEAERFYNVQLYNL